MNTSKKREIASSWVVYIGSQKLPLIKGHQVPSLHAHFNLTELEKNELGEMAPTDFKLFMRIVRQSVTYAYEHYQKILHCSSCQPSRKKNIMIIKFPAAKHYSTSSASLSKLANLWHYYKE